MSSTTSRRGCSSPGGDGGDEAAPPTRFSCLLFTVMRVEDLRLLPLFGDLSDDQITQLIAASTVVRIEPGVELFHEGEPADFWWALVDGAIELSRRVGREESVVGRMDAPGR